MNVRIMFWICLFFGILHAIKTMAHCRKHGRPISSVDNNIFTYFIGQ
jgi:hypothetical protein